MSKPAFCICENKAQISFAVTAKLISAFVLATWIVQFLFVLNPTFPASKCTAQFLRDLFRVFGNQIVGVCHDEPHVSSNPVINERSHVSITVRILAKVITVRILAKVITVCTNTCKSLLYIPRIFAKVITVRILANVITVRILAKVITVRILASHYCTNTPKSHYCTYTCKSHYCTNTCKSHYCTNTCKSHYCTNTCKSHYCTSTCKSPDCTMGKWIEDYF